MLRLSHKNFKAAIEKCVNDQLKLLLNQKKKIIKSQQMKESYKEHYLEIIELKKYKTGERNPTKSH